MIWKIFLWHGVSLGIQLFITLVARCTWSQNKSPPPWAHPSFFVLSSQSPTRGGSSNLIPQRQVCTGTEPSSGQVWNQRKWSQHFQSQGNNGIPTGGTAGNTLALFPPAVVCWPHMMQQMNIVFFAWGGESYLYVSVENMFRTGNCILHLAGGECKAG